MKPVALVFLLILAASPLLAQCGHNCYFYGGDFSYTDATARGLALVNALSNETDAIVSGFPYGAATYQNFVVTGALGVEGLFTNNLSGLNPTTGYWEIRKGVSEGNGGTLIASGNGAMTQTPTGRSGFGFKEYQDLVNLYFVLPAGTYWFAVVPNDPNNPNRSFNTNTYGLNSIGTTIPNQQYFNSPFFGANFTNADNWGSFPRFSSGVYRSPCGERGSCSHGSVSDAPEPSSLTLIGTGLVGAALAVCRRCFS